MKKFFLILIVIITIMAAVNQVQAQENLWDMWLMPTWCGVGVNWGRDPFIWVEAHDDSGNRISEDYFDSRTVGWRTTMFPSNMGPIVHVTAWGQTPEGESIGPVSGDFGNECYEAPVTETPTVTPVPPTETPVPPTATPEQHTETPTEAPTATPAPTLTVIAPTDTGTLVPPTETPVQTQEPVSPEPTPQPVVLVFSSAAPIGPWDPAFEAERPFSTFEVLVDGQIVPAIKYSPGAEIIQVDANGDEVKFVVPQQCGFYRIMIDTTHGVDISLMIDESVADVSETSVWLPTEPNRCFYDSVNETVYAVYGSTVSQLAASAGAETIYGSEGAVAAFAAVYGTFIEEGRVYRAAFGQ